MNPVFVDQRKNINIVVVLYNKEYKTTNNKAKNPKIINSFFKV